MILLDIDGVLNPLFSFTLQEDGYLTFKKGWASWSLNADIHAPMLEKLDTISSIHWCSSWIEESNYINVYFGLSRVYDCVPLRNDGFVNQNHEEETWKLNSVKEYVKNYKGKIVWIDDELYADAFSWAELRGSDTTFLIKTDPSVGLTNLQYQQIVDFYNKK
jgi:hypothetical protein